MACEKIGKNAKIDNKKHVHFIVKCTILLNFDRFTDENLTKLNFEEKMQFYFHRN